MAGVAACQRQSTRWRLIRIQKKKLKKDYFFVIKTIDNIGIYVQIFKLYLLPNDVCHILFVCFEL